MPNLEEAPHEVFEWLEKFDLYQMSEKDRNTVLTYFTKEEYEEMRSAMLLFQRRADSEQNLLHNKSKVLERFDAFHDHKKGRHSTLVWKIAAGLLPFFLLAVTYWFTKGEDQAKQALVVYDTVYLKETTPGPVIYDTIFIEKELSKGSGSKSRSNSPRTLNRAGSNLEFSSEIGVVPFNEKEEIQNRMRNYSTKDDSLFDLFPSVSL